MFLSVAHSHFVDTTIENGIEFQIEQDTNECTICASHFKISATSDIQTGPITFHWVTAQEISNPSVESPLVGIHNERAPPFLIRG